MEKIGALDAKGKLISELTVKEAGELLQSMARNAVHANMASISIACADEMASLIARVRGEKLRM